MGVIGGIDEVCFNRDRLFFGGKGKTVLYPDYDTRINAESIIEKYWNDDFEQYISNAKPKSKKKKDSTAAGIGNRDRQNKNLLVYKDITDAISTLNIPVLQERLGIRGDLIGTDRRRYSLLVLTQSPETEKSDNGKCCPRRTTKYKIGKCCDTLYNCCQNEIFK